MTDPAAASADRSPPVAVSDPLPGERQQQILQLLREQGRVLAAPLALRFGVSEDSIRRDLRELAARGQCRRVHGGALPITPVYAPLDERHGEAAQRKQALADAAVAQLGQAQSLLLDAGSTNSAIARALPHSAPDGHAALQVLTNAPDIALALLASSAVDITLLGGRLQRRSGAVLGAQALQSMQTLRADVSCIGVCALDVEGGLWAIDGEEAVLKRAMRERSDRHLVVVSNEKLGAVATFRIGELDERSVLVCEADAPAAAVATLRSLGVAIVHAQAAGN